MSEPFKQKGPAQAVEVDQKEGTPGKNEGGKSEQAKRDDKKLPGADGKSSAGANEDTYD